MLAILIKTTFFPTFSNIFNILFFFVLIYYSIFMFLIYIYICFFFQYMYVKIYYGVVYLLSNIFTVVQLQ